MAIIDESTGGPISLDEAKKWTKNFRDKHPGDEEVKAHMFGKKTIHKVLNQPGCMGMRIYYALDDTGQKHLLLVGVDKEGNDQIPKSGFKTDASDLESADSDSIMDRSTPCPPDCPTQSPLMN